MQSWCRFKTLPVLILSVKVTSTDLKGSTDDILAANKFMVVNRWTLYVPRLWMIASTVLGLDFYLHIYYIRRKRTALFRTEGSTCMYKSAWLPQCQKKSPEIVHFQLYDLQKHTDRCRWSYWIYWNILFSWRFSKDEGNALVESALTQMSFLLLLILVKCYISYFYHNLEYFLNIKGPQSLQLQSLYGA